MTQFFDENGRMFAGTLLQVGPVVVTRVKTADSADKYTSVQVGYGEKNEKNINKAQKGQFKDLGNFRFVKEFRVDAKEAALFNVGDKIDASIFEKGDKIIVSSTSKGKGFQGVVKRHGFKGGQRTHGQKHSEREAGSIGATWPQRVLKGKRMAGRMGTERITIKNLRVLDVDTENNIILVKGAIPGNRGVLVEVKK